MKLTLISKLMLTSILVFTFVSNAQESHNHNHNQIDTETITQSPVMSTDEDEHVIANQHNNEKQIKLSAAQLRLAEIKVEVLEQQIINDTLYAPAEIKANGYTSYVVSPRIDSIVLTRHVALGDEVKKNQALVTLFSDVLAQAQADYRIDYSEWHRVKSLGKTVVSEKSKSEAQTRYLAALAKLKAYGLTKTMIQTLTIDNSSSLGEYTLVATQSGSVLTDDFQQGQSITAGQKLIVLADESELWVEAMLSPNAKIDLPTNSPALLVVNGKSYAANVIQKAHIIDPKTRTRVVRLSVKNNQHQLHSGMFAEVFFKLKSKDKILAVPETALIRANDGDWQVFIEISTGVFIAKEVELGRTFQNLTEISGVESGERVVTQGTFFIASEQAKSGFDPHNH